MTEEEKNILKRDFMRSLTNMLDAHAKMNDGSGYYIAPVSNYYNASGELEECIKKILDAIPTS